MKKNGFSLFTLILLVLIIGFGGIMGWKVGRPYMEASTVENLIANTLKEIQTEPTLTEVEIRQRLFTKINVQGFVIPFDDIKIRPLGEGTYELEVDMTTMIPLWDRAYILLQLNPVGASK